MADMVYEQGTILDRIDVNIDQTFQNIKNSNIQLDKVQKYFLIKK